MDIDKYRKWYLSENWAENRFRMIIYNTRLEPQPLVSYYARRIRSLEPHPWVSSGQAFWVNSYDSCNGLCIGYRLDSNPNIYRPIFSCKRQRLLDKVHKDICCPAVFWRKIKQRYYFCISKVKKIPLECVIHIVQFIY